VLARTYNLLLSGGDYTFRNYMLFRYPLLRPIFAFLWNRTRGRVIEGINAAHAGAIKTAVTVPVICTGGFQTASFIRRVIADGSCDAVSIARSLIANNDLVQQFASGLDRPARPCTYCNKCLANVVANPLGCYELSRYGGDYDAMMREVMSVFHPTGFETTAPEVPSTAPGAP
jgi:2,4-dienoyl-CoA reductase (NADPH2)